MVPEDPAYTEVLLALSHSEQLHDTSPEYLAAVLQEGRLVHVAAGEIVVEEGSLDTDALYIVVSGTVDVFVDGRFIYSLSDVGASFGEIAAFSKRPRMAQVVASAPCVLIELSHRRFAGLRDSDPGRYCIFVELLLFYIAEKLRVITRKVLTYEDLVLQERAHGSAAAVDREVEDKIRQILLYSHVIESSPSGIVIADAQGLVVQANAAACGMFGWAAGTPPADPVTGLFPSLKDKLVALFENRAGNLKSETEIHTVGWGPLTVEVTGSPVLHRRRVIAFALVIRDMRQVHELLESKESYQALFQGSPVPMHVYAKDTLEILDANDMSLRLYGYTRKEFLSLTLKDLRPPDAVPQLMRWLNDAPASVGPIRLAEIFRHRKKDGTPVDVEIAVHDFSYHGRPARICLVLDVTDRLRAERELKESEQRYRDVIEGSLQGIGIIQDDRFVFANQALADTLGYPSVQALLAMPSALQQLAPHERVRIREYMMRRLAGEPVPNQYEAQFQRVDGSYLWVYLVVRMVVWNGKPATQVASVDISDQKRAERKLQETQTQMLQSDKMASLGQLAAGVAHEINNPMGFVYSNLSTFRDYFTHISRVLELYGTFAAQFAGASPQAQAALAEIEHYKKQVDFDYILKDSPAIISDSLEGTSRVVEIVKNLKEFSHVDEASKQLVNLNANIESTLKLIWNELKYKVEVEKDYGDIGEIECYPQQINQVILNLLLNAAQSIEKAGTIRIRTTSEPGGVSVSIQDTGCGISQENLAKIYDPFFTTKPIGKGTGLGLSIVYGIVREHHGRIDATSIPGLGTTFTIHLPAVFDPQPAQGETP